MPEFSSSLTAISPIDGRYCTRTQPLTQFFSEYALVKHRVIVEIAWLKSLSMADELEEVQKLSMGSVEKLDAIIANFSVQDAAAVKEIEKTTNHDVKAVEYWLRQTLKSAEGIAPVTPFIHFACTSEDINNVSYALMMKGALDNVILPKLDSIISVLNEHASKYVNEPMLARTSKSNHDGKRNSKCGLSSHSAKKLISQVEFTGENEWCSWKLQRSS